MAELDLIPRQLLRVEEFPESSLKKFLGNQGKKLELIKRLTTRGGAFVTPSPSHQPAGGEMHAVYRGGAGDRRRVWRFHAADAHLARSSAR
jgi:hypothetical protein